MLGGFSPRSQPAKSRPHELSDNRLSRRKDGCAPQVVESVIAENRRKADGPATKIGLRDESPINEALRMTLCLKWVRSHEVSRHDRNRVSSGLVLDKKDIRESLLRTKRDRWVDC